MVAEDKPIDPVSADEAGSLIEHRRGVGYYRWLRPFELHGVALGFDVVDVSTRESLGGVYVVDADPEAENMYLISGHTTAAPDESVRSWNGEQFAESKIPSAWEAADALWRMAFPVKSRWWLGMRRVVHVFDAGRHVLALAMQGALALLVLVFAVDLVGFLWEVRDVVQEIALQWLREVRDGATAEGVT